LILARESVDSTEFMYEEQYSLPQGKRQRVIRKKVKALSFIRMVAGTLAISCLFLVGLSCIYIKAKVARSNWEMNQIIRNNEMICSEIEKLKSEVASVGALDKIEYLAVTDLGMVKNPSIEYLDIDNFSNENNLDENNTNSQSVSDAKNEKLIKVVCEAILKNIN